MVLSINVTYITVTWLLKVPKSIYITNRLYDFPESMQ